MFVNLANSGFDHLHLSLSLETDYDEVRQAWETVDFSPPHSSDAETHHLVLARFRRGRRSYQLFAVLARNDGDGARLSLSYSYGEGRITKEHRSNMDKLARVLDDLAAPCSVACLATGDFSTDTLMPIVGLPLMRFHTSDSHFDEIRGIRLVRLEDDIESSSVVIDMYPENVLRVSTETSYTSLTSSDIPTDALRRLTSLKDHAVVEVPAATQEEG